MNNLRMGMSLADEIKARIRVSDIAAEYGEIRKRGRLHVCRCLCGQNSDRNPSFTLYEDDPNGGHFHCYACQRHGSVIDLVMLVEGLDFKTALAQLRDRLGGIGNAAPRYRASFHPASTITPSRGDVTPSVKALLSHAVDYYQHTLQQTPQAQALLHRRGLTDETIQALRLGYSDGTLVRGLHLAGQNLALAARIGLLNPRGELLANRLIFPVLDLHDAPVWLIGRATQDRQQPKYLGLPDGLTHKRPMTSGVAKRGVLIVEGAIDFATLVQWGMPSDWLCIGLLGTAHGKVTESLAAQHTQARVRLVLDQDTAGKDAALKAALALREHGLQPSIVVDADRHAQQCTSTNVSREIALVEQLQQHSLVHWVHWCGMAKDCGDLLMQGQVGEAMFQQAVQS